MNTHRGRRRLLALAVTALAMGGAVTVARPADAGVSAVDEVGRSFTPKRVDVAVNDKVVWTNQSNGTHTVTFDNGPDLHATCDPDALLRVGCQGPGATAERTFTAPGSYSYYCKFHGGRGGAGMAGVVVVLAATTSATSPASTTTTASRASTTTTTVKASTSSTTTTTRPLATSSTVITSTTTTTSEATSVLLPGEPPPFSDDTSSAANRSGNSKGGSDSGTVALIVALLLAASAGGGYLLWRLRPGRP
jgi:plastocyanin